MTCCLILVQDAEAWEREPQTEKDRVYSEHMKVYLPRYFNCYIGAA